MFLLFPSIGAPKQFLIFGESGGFPNTSCMIIFIIIHTCEEVPRDKKPAKLLLFFDMIKFFLKKMQNFFIFFSFAISACHFGGLFGGLSLGVSFFFSLFSLLLVVCVSSPIG